MNGGQKVSVADVIPILTRLGITIKTEKGLSIFKAPISEYILFEKWRSLEQWVEYETLGMTHLPEYKVYKSKLNTLRKKIRRIDKEALATAKAVAEAKEVVANAE